MKTIIVRESEASNDPVVILSYDDSKISSGSICEHVFTILEILCEQDGSKLTSDLFEICEEIKQ